MRFKIKKRFSLLLVLISAIAMIVLMLIQYYWTTNTIKAQESNFERSVHEAMTKVIYQVDKLEMANRIKGRLKSVGKGSILFHTVDSINQLLSKEFDKMIVDSIIDDSIINITKERISIEISADKYGKPVKRIDTSIIYYEKQGKSKEIYEHLFLDDFETDSNFINYYHAPVVVNDVDSLMQEFDKLLKKSFIVSDVIEDLFNFSHYLPIQDRVDIQVLDSLIKFELLSKDITTSYNFGIYNVNDKNFIYKKTSLNSGKLLSSGQSFLLFPSDFFSAQNYLYIYFPYRKAYILHEIRRTLFISFFLIVSITSIFIYVLVSFVRQKKLSEVRNDFVNNMTHEFKTPISTITLVCEALNDPSINKDENTYKTYIDIIEKENIRLATMAEKILQTAMIDHRQIQLKTEVIQVNKIIQTAIQNIIIQVEQKKGKIETQFLAQNHAILADKVHFTNIIYNLLDNATKYTNGPPEIIIRTTNEKDNLIIEISDKGIGIHKKELSKIFDKLYRISQGNIHNVKGFGLGLSYVKAIVDMHKGKISVESEIEKGSTFKLYFKIFNENEK